MKLPKLYSYRFRSSETGKFVSRAYAKANPKTTIRQRFWRWEKGFQR